MPHYNCLEERGLLLATATLFSNGSISQSAKIAILFYQWQVWMLQRC